MRVISGKYGGLSLVSVSKLTHPMSEKVRGAIFNSLGDVSGLRVLDAFAGSGALGFEALSRGAGSVTAIESNGSAQADIAKNKQKLAIGNEFRLVKTKVKSWLDENYEKFDLILVDPPYNNTQLDVLDGLAKSLNRAGILIISLPPREDTPDIEGATFDSRKNYGDASLVIYKNNQ